MDCYMGIDVGTSSVKAMIMDVSGKTVGIGYSAYDIMKPYADYAEQSMEFLWEATKEAIRMALLQSSGAENEIKGIGLSGQMHGLVLLGEDGKPIRNAIIWADQRSQDAIEDIYSCIPREEYGETTLNSVSTGFFVSSLLWVRKHEPELYKKVCKAILPKDYIRYRLCGELATDKSDASATLIFDVKRRDWAHSFIKKLGIRESLFVPSLESYEIAGEVTKFAQEETGIIACTPVVCGGGDTLMQAVGNGIIAPGILASNIGTASQLTCAVESPVYDGQFRTNTFCHVKEGLWSVVGANLSGGVSLKWLMKNILKMENYDEMTNLAAKVSAGSEGLLFLPYLSGERTPYQDPNAKGIYLGLTLTHSREHLIRSTMEGVVFALKNSLEIFEGMDIRFHKIIASGGGARSRLFMQIQADMFGEEIYTGMSNEQACLGAIITAAVGTGGFRDFGEACNALVKLKEEYIIPDPENQKIYQERFRAFKQLYKKNKELL